MLQRALLTMAFLQFDRVETSNFTVDKAPLSVDNLIKQGDFASLHGCFQIKPREQKDFTGGFRPKTG